jgi:uncharacterized protein YciI
MQQFAFIYFMKREPEKIQSVVPRHVAYWHELNLRNYMGGPFDDRSGGLIIFNSESKERAELLVSSDPFVSEDLLTQSWLKEWIQE